MFNNLFDSFHNTVVESKREREQLDRLLTISTPRERLLIVVIAVLLFIFATWIFFGDVTRSLTLDGALVEPDGNSLADDRSVSVIVWIKRNTASRIRAGMPALMELDLSGEEATTLDGEITAISAVPLSKELTVLESEAPVSMQRIDLALSESLDISSISTRKPRIVIELDSQPLVTLLRMGPP